MPPPLPPAPLGFVVGCKDASTSPKVVVEAFVDLNCPFSRKAHKTLAEVAQAYADKPVQLLFHQVIQPWHPAGCSMHEAALAVRAIKPEAYMAYMHKVYDAQERFSDAETMDKSRAQLNAELISLAAEVGVDTAALSAQLAITEGKNSGTATTQAVKFATKYHRTRGVHVTPTVFVNGLEAVQVSSSWSLADWKEFLDNLLAA